MTTPADSLFSDPSVQFLQKLLDDVRKGDIILPRFQRPFVWDKERRLDLFDSVRRGIPIGSLMIWETRALGDDAQIVSKTELGPFMLPKMPDRAPRRYLLDGEQRLMTLYFALYRPDPREDKDAAGEEPAAAFEVFFDLEELLHRGLRQGRARIGVQVARGPSVLARSWREAKGPLAHTAAEAAAPLRLPVDPLSRAVVDVRAADDDPRPW